MATATPDAQRFGKYQIIERIAAGGMAEIFKARLDGIGGFHRTFAIKRILPHLTANAEFVDMLVDEAKIAGLLSHANIVQILDLGSIDQHYYIAMEYVNGRDLGQVLKRCSDKGITLPVPHAVFVLLEMLKGLEYAHNRQVMRNGKPQPLNIVHRDISPANVLCSFQGEVKLTDFGIAKASVRALETMSGIVKGRFDYMSPEQASGLGVDQRADIFSAGVVLYELLAGRHPFRKPGEIATIEAVRRGIYDAPSYVNPDVPYALDVIVENALKADPAERYQTATQFKDALDRFFHDAGFIFSASTLAAFLRGLFPELDGRAARKEGPDQDTRILDPDDVVLDEEESSPSSDRATVARPAPTVAPTPSFVPRMPFPGDTTVQQAANVLRAVTTQGASPAGLGEESTLIRPAGAGPYNDAETVIRPDPGLGAVDPPTAVMKSISGDPVRAPAAVRFVARTPSQVHAVYLILAFSTLVAGFVFGLLAGRAHHDQTFVVAKRDPVLEVAFPAASTLSVDGRALAGPSPVTTTLVAGQPATIRVEEAGRAPRETTVTLDYNQMRVLSFEAVTAGTP